MIERNGQPWTRLRPSCIQICAPELLQLAAQLLYRLCESLVTSRANSQASTLLSAGHSLVNEVVAVFCGPIIGKVNLD